MQHGRLLHFPVLNTTVLTGIAQICTAQVYSLKRGITRRGFSIKETWENEPRTSHTINCHRSKLSSTADVWACVRKGMAGEVLKLKFQSIERKAIELGIMRRIPQV